MNASPPTGSPDPHDGGADPENRGSAGRAEAAGVVVVSLAASWVLATLRDASPTVTTISVAAALAIPAVAAWSILRRNPPRITLADRVTLVRVALIGFLTAALVLTLADEMPARTWTVLIVAALAALLDAVDGWVARSAGGGTTAGARFDAEADAAALLVFSALLAITVGWWVLLIGLMRYVFAAASIFRPQWRGTLPYSGFRRAVAAIQSTVLVVGLGPVVPVPLATGLAAAGLGILLLSFGRDVCQLERSPHADGFPSGKSA